MTAAELAARMGLSVDAIDDVRIAVEEAFVFASARAGAEGEVAFTFAVLDGAFEVVVETGEGECGGFADDETGGRYARFILEGVCDEFELSGEGEPCRVRVLKRPE